MERSVVKGAAPAVWLAVAGAGGDQGLVNGQLRTAPEWEARRDDREAAVLNSVEDAACMAWEAPSTKRRRTH